MNFLLLFGICALTAASGGAGPVPAAGGRTVVMYRNGLTAAALIPLADESAADVVAAAGTPLLESAHGCALEHYAREAFGLELSSGDRVWSSSGEQVVKAEQLVGLADDDFLVAGRHYEHFTRPPVAIGHKQMVVVGAGASRRRVELETLSLRPLVFRAERFLEEEACDGIIAEATPKLERSTTGPAGSAQLSPTRTSETAWMSPSEGLSGVVMKECFNVAGIPYHFSFADGLQVLRYQPGQFYKEHTDFFDNKQYSDERGGMRDRFVTVFLHLMEAESGGTTTFPRATEFPRSHPRVVNVSAEDAGTVPSCARGLSVRGTKGSATIFYSMVGGEGDYTSEHAACPVLRGTKYGANVWIWNGDFRTIQQKLAPPSPPDPSSVTVSFVNQCPFPVNVAWVNGDEAIHMIVVAADQTGSMNSYANHKFRFTRGGAAGEGGGVVTAGDLVVPSDVPARPQQPVICSRA